MIIDCPCGKKKFSVKDELIPAKGRLLQCGECDREWFYSKNINTINETNVEIPDEEIAQESFGIIEDKYDNVNLSSVFVKDKNNNYGTVCSSIIGLPNKKKIKNNMVWLNSEYKSSFNHLL